MGPHLAMLAHSFQTGQSLNEWALRRLATVGESPSARRSHARGGSEPPLVRFADVQDAVRWFGGTQTPLAYTWVLYDSLGRRVADSAWAFPTSVMAERDARVIQEFVDQLDLNFVESHDRAFAWYAQLDGNAALHASTAYESRDEAIHGATVVIGLLPVATVAAHAVDASVNP